MDNEKNMRKTTTKIAAVPLFVILVAVVIQLAVLFVIRRGFFSGIAKSEDALLLLSSFSQVAAYFLAVLFVKFVMGRDLVRVMFKPRRGVNPVPLVFAACGLIIAASRFSAIVNDTFYGYFGGGSESDMFAEYNIFVIMIVNVIIPAFFEELVFRGLILTNLLPFGKTFAIIVSGIIFGVMHGTVSQILFATLAGIVLGWVYVETGSLWCGIFVHFVNNLVSVCESGIISALPYETAVKYIYIIEIAVLALGLISAVYAVSVMSKKKERATENGFFGIKPETFRPAEKTVELKAGLAAFFNPVMIIFILYSFVPILL